MPFFGSFPRLQLAVPQPITPEDNFTSIFHIIPYLLDILRTSDNYYSGSLIIPNFKISINIIIQLLAYHLLQLIMCVYLTNIDITESESIRLSRVFLDIRLTHSFYQQFGSIVFTCFT